MKMFLQIVFALLFIVGLFFLLGYMVTEQKNINEVKVKAPMEVCWSIYRDESRLSEWMEGVSSIELTEGRAGEVGSKQRMIMSSPEGASITSSASELTRTITKVSEPKAFSYDYTNAMMDGNSHISFSQRDSMTTIKSVDVFSGKKLWLRSTLFLMKKSINDKTQIQFDKLKDIIEYDYKTQLKKQAKSQTEKLNTGNEIED